MSFVIPGAEPFYFPGGKTACLLVHGFTGTPKEMRLLGEHLAAQGHTVLGVRLAGHATRKEDMLRMRWQDWLADVEDGYSLLKSNAERVIIMGLSMGGMLSLLFAAQHEVDGLVIMASPHHLPHDPRLSFLVPLSWVQPFRPKGQSHWFDMQAYAQQASYKEEPLRSLAELRDLAAQMRASLAQVTAPALLIYSRQDRTVTMEERHAELIQSAINSAEKEILWIENSSHVLTRDAQRETVFCAAADFVSHLMGGTP